MNFNISSEFNEVEDSMMLCINGIPHLCLREDGFCGMQSYIDGLEPPDKKWVIELYYKGTDPIVVEYNSREKWEAVLAELKKIL